MAKRECIKFFGKMGVSKEKEGFIFIVLNIPVGRPFDERSSNCHNKILYIMLRIGTERAMPQFKIVQWFHPITP